MPMPWSSSSSPSNRRDVIRPPRSGWISISHGPPRNLMALWTVLSLCLLAACGHPPTAHRPSPSPTPQATIASPSTAPTPVSDNTPHVFVIVMENRSYDQALAGTYTAQLASKYAVATNYHGVAHPSLPNYLPLPPGRTRGIPHNAWHPLPPAGPGPQLTAPG